MQVKTILIVDDEFSVRESLEKVLSKAGYVTLSADSGNEALAVLSKEKVDLVLSDLKMPDGDGVELLKSIKKNYPDVEVILLTGYGTVENAVEAMREGAYDFITKPPKKAIILSAVERASERQNLALENKYLREQLSKGAPLDEVVGRSPAFAKILEMVNRVAPLVSTVLITGESGTGKELIARAIHRQSPRANNKFIPVNCAAIPENLVESELFGYMRGAFTGATRDKVGLFKVAEGGTIFLDEIVSVPLNLQVKLLRAIEQKEIMPVGGTKPEIIDIRIIAATNKNLAEEVEKGYFRTDLYYRLNVIDILIPPLRERVDDIPELVGHFLKVYNVQLNKKISRVDPAVLNVFKSYEWKGNVRELENVIERAMIMCDGDRLRLEHFAHFYSQQNAAEELQSGLKGAVRRFERDTILKSLEMAGHDKGKAAGMLGMSLSSLYRKMAELGIASKE
ncbi:sigma-54 dependent transcriptional regulator [candidate division KSB1 bacterium]|nr:sigma-54 dependent transcriptional regulator [candidate division KSB1 bacterium]